EIEPRLDGRLDRPDVVAPADDRRFAAGRGGVTNDTGISDFLDFVITCYFDIPGDHDQVFHPWAQPDFIAREQNPNLTVSRTVENEEGGCVGEAVPQLEFNVFEVVSE